MLAAIFAQCGAAGNPQTRKEKQPQVLHAKTGQLTHLEIRTTEQLLGTPSRIVAGVAVYQFFPRVDVQLRKHTANPQAFGSRQHGITIAEGLPEEIAKNPKVIAAYLGQ